MNLELWNGLDTQLRLDIQAEYERYDQLSHNYFKHRGDPYLGCVDFDFQIGYHKRLSALSL